MRLRDAAKLETGDKIRCGPNTCGCDGRVYAVIREEQSCGCVMLHHNNNDRPFAIIPSKDCGVFYQKGIRPYWNIINDNQAMNLARNLRRA